MRIKIKIGACWLSGKYLGKHFRRRQYTEQVLLYNLHARYSCFWIIPAILLFIISYSFPTSVEKFLKNYHKETLHLYKTFFEAEHDQHEQINTILLRIFRRYLKQEEPRFSSRRKSRPYYPEPI